MSATTKSIIDVRLPQIIPQIKLLCIKYKAMVSDNEAENLIERYESRLQKRYSRAKAIYNHNIFFIIRKRSCAEKDRPVSNHPENIA